MKLRRAVFIGAPLETVTIPAWMEKWDELPSRWKLFWFYCWHWLTNTARAIWR